MENQDFIGNYFKYTCMIDPIKQFHGCMDVEDYASNMRVHDTGIEFIDTVTAALFAGLALAKYLEVIEKTEALCDKTPHKVMFFSIPALEGKHFTPCAITQVGEENTTFLFTSNFDFASMYAADGREVRIW